MEGKHEFLRQKKFKHSKISDDQVLDLMESMELDEYDGDFDDPDFWMTYHLKSSNVFQT